MERFFTADLHFAHQSIIRHCDRPYDNVHEMNEALVENWNSVVTEKSLVYILGDFAWMRPDYWMDRLNGQKILIIGNHDTLYAGPVTQIGPYFDMFSLPRLGEAGGVASGTEAFYAFDYANIHFHAFGSYTASGGNTEGNKEVVKLMNEKDMGVLIISPNDKGGR